MAFRFDEPAEGPLAPPSVDEVGFKSLYAKRFYEVKTRDGWTLVTSRYQPLRQAFAQPIFGAPILLVHGWSQNRHCWTSGEFVKNLLYFGADIHVAELRGHGLSSVALQRRRARESGAPPPADLAFGWDLDSYLLEDLPALVEGVRRETWRRPYLVGHSMGGMLAYGYAGMHPADLAGLVTIGSPAELGRGWPLLQVAAWLWLVGGPLLDGALAAVNLARRVAGRARVELDHVPVDELLLQAERVVSRPALLRALYSAGLPLWPNPANVAAETVRWLVRQGGEKEPRRVVEQFTRWIRRGELSCERTGWRYADGFSRLTMPMAIFFGDRDRLATLDSTRAVYRGARSEYLLWRPVKGNTHLELTLGYDIRQICYDVKNLVDYGEHAVGRKALPRAGRD